MQRSTSPTHIPTAPPSPSRPQRSSSVSSSSHVESTEQRKPRFLGKNSKKFDMDLIFVAPLFFNDGVIQFSNNAPVDYKTNADFDHFQYIRFAFEDLDKTSLSSKNANAHAYNAAVLRVQRIMHMYCFQLPENTSLSDQDKLNRFSHLQLDDCMKDAFGEEGPSDLYMRAKFTNYLQDHTLSKESKRNRVKAVEQATAVECCCPILRSDSEAFPSVNHVSGNAQSMADFQAELKLDTGGLTKFAVWQRNVQYGFAQTITKSFCEWVPPDLNCEAPNAPKIDWDTNEVYILQGILQTNAIFDWRFGKHPHIKDGASIQYGTTGFQDKMTNFMKHTSVAMFHQPFRTQSNSFFEAWQTTLPCREVDIFEHQAMKLRCQRRFSQFCELSSLRETTVNKHRTFAATMALNTVPPQLEVAATAFKQFTTEKRFVSKEIENGSGKKFSYTPKWQRYLSRLQLPPGQNGKYVFDRILNMEADASQDPNSTQGIRLRSAACFDQTTQSQHDSTASNVMYCMRNIALHTYYTLRSEREVGTGQPSKIHHVNKQYKEWQLEMESRQEYGWMKPRFSNGERQHRPSKSKFSLNHYRVQFAWKSWYVRNNITGRKGRRFDWPSEAKKLEVNPLTANSDATDAETVHSLMQPIQGDLHPVDHDRIDEYTTFWLSKKICQWQWVPPLQDEQRNDFTYLDPLNLENDLSLYLIKENTQKGNTEKEIYLTTCKVRTQGERRELNREYYILLLAWMQIVIDPGILPENSVSETHPFHPLQWPQYVQTVVAKMKQQYQTASLDSASADNPFSLWTATEPRKKLLRDKITSIFASLPVINEMGHWKASFEMWFELCHGFWAPYMADWRESKQQKLSHVQHEYWMCWDPFLCLRWHMVLYNCNRWQPETIRKALNRQEKRKKMRQLRQQMQNSASGAETPCDFDPRTDVMEPLIRTAPDNFMGYTDPKSSASPNVEIDLPPILLFCGEPLSDSEDSTFRRPAASTADTTQLMIGNTRSDNKIDLEFLGYQDVPIDINEHNDQLAKLKDAMLRGNGPFTKDALQAGSNQSSGKSSGQSTPQEPEEIPTEQKDDAEDDFFQDANQDAVMHDVIQQLRNLQDDMQDDTSTETKLINSNVLFGCALATRWQPKATQNTQEVTVLNNSVLQNNEWYFMPKYDGVRCRWDGSQLWSRSGLTEYQAPQWFRNALPSTLSLDGELWVARNAFETTLSKVRSKNPDDWKEIIYVVFDCPSYSAPYLDRLHHAQEELNKQSSRQLDGNSELTAKCVKVVGCETRASQPNTAMWCERLRTIDDVNKALDHEQQLFGEGLMARRNDALYLPGRSNSLVKIKAKRDDEAIVVHCGKGLGHFQGQMGYLWCRTRWGAEFDLSAGLTKEQRQWNTAANKALREGTVITFTYTDLTVKRKRPKQAVFVRVRQDVSASEFPGWECIGDVKHAME